MIKLRIANPTVVAVFTPSDEFLGMANEESFLDLQIQICEQGVSGYYFMFNDKKYIIDRFGRAQDWPSGLFMKTTELTIKHAKLITQKIKDDSQKMVDNNILPK